MENVGRFVAGTIVFVLGCSLIGLDIHIAFRTTTFAHPTNIALGIVVLLVGLSMMFWNWFGSFFQNVTDGIRAWRAK